MEPFSSSSSTTSEFRDNAQWAQERKVNRADKDKVLNCPRCNSSNTKFCYYNNYSLTQPRYFCKTCRRYWTAGGNLRNIPVGGGSRKKNKTSSAVAASSNQNITHHLSQQISLSYQNPKPLNQDLNLSSFSSSQVNQFYNAVSQFPKIENDNSRNYLIQTTLGFPFGHQEPKPTLGFSVDGSNMTQDINGGRVLFPFGVLKQVSSTTGEVLQDQNSNTNNSKFEQGNSTGYWNGTSWFNN